MATATELMEMISAGGRRSYEDDGHVAPIVFLFNAEGVGLGLQPTPSDDERPPHLLGRLVALALPLMEDTRYIGATAEGWSKMAEAISPEDAKALGDTIQHGDLQKWHDAGDQSIKTSVIAMLLDMEEPEKSMSGHVVDPRTDAQIEAGEPFEWDERMDHIEGWPEGDFAATLQRAYLGTKSALGTLPNELLKQAFDIIRGEERTIEKVVAWVAQIAKTGVLRGAVWFPPGDEPAAYIKLIQVDPGDPRIGMYGPLDIDDARKFEEGLG